MTWKLLGQYSDVLLSCVLIARLFYFKLASNYRAFLVFVVYDSLQSLIYLAFVYFLSRGQKFMDYRILWCSLRLIAWVTTVWMVYALLKAILKQLPGILRFSLGLLNSVFAISLVVAAMTVRPEYTASRFTAGGDWRNKLLSLALAVERALSFAEILAILAILTFILFFPIRVPRNLAAFSVGLSTYLVLDIGSILLRTYLPVANARLEKLDPIPLVVAACLIYWIFSLNPAGEEARVTLGRGWQSVPRDHLVRQLETMNAALLRSREQS